MARKTSSRASGRRSSTSLKRRYSASSPSDNNSCHAYLYPKKEFHAGKDVDDRLARSLFDMANTEYREEIIRHAVKDIAKCCIGGVKQHNILMAVNWHKPDNFGMLFITV